MCRFPRTLGWRVNDDAVHLTHAIDVDRVLLTHNYHDFANLHNLVGKSRGHHPGILVVCKENNPKRDLQARDIVRALEKLLASGQAFPDEFHNLNQWR
jgi:hypothetical protein